MIGESAVTAGRAFTTNRGQAIALFDHAGALIEMYYIGNTDLNRDNAPVVNGDANNLDEISFVATDDGISIDLVNNRFVYGQPETAPIATAEITILPQNDVPVAGDDEIRMDNADLDPATNVDVTAWEQFFGIGVVPEPTEDTPLTIPGAFLIQNDLRGRASAADENIDPLEADNNDLRIVVASATANWDTNSLGGSVTVNPATGDVELMPPTDQFGDISFTYTVKDLGANEFIDGTQNTQMLESLPATVTVAIQPVNDVPVAHDRSLEFIESGDDVADEFTFTANQLLNGDGVSETPNTPHVDTTTLPSPFNEASQQLRVVEFTTLAGTVEAPTGGDGDVALLSDAGGEYTFTFANFAFVSGTFKASPNYNERDPFNSLETFTYRVADDGLASATGLNQGYQDFYQPDEFSLIDQQGTVSISVAETNDAPIFTIPNLILDVLEDNDGIGVTVVEDFAEQIFPGPLTAIDELANQFVEFDTSNVVTQPIDPNFLIELSPTGVLTVTTTADYVGQAIVTVIAEDFPNDGDLIGFDQRSTVETITVNVRAVNDAPRLNGNVVGTSDSNGPDEAWSVAPEDALGQVPITYTLREDNTQSGDVMQDYLIPVTSATGPGYQQLGLLDVFTVGPDNELVDVFPGAVPFDTASEQRLELIAFGSPSALDPAVVVTDRGGRLAVNELDPVTGLVTELRYTPPLDFNDFSGFDSFSYTVQDNKANGDETYDLGLGDLVQDNLTRTNRVFLQLNRVNDRPIFNIPNLILDVLEDNDGIGVTVVEDFAEQVFPGPLTAIDELANQFVEFDTSNVVTQPIDPNFLIELSPTGVLTVTTTADYVGQAIVTVIAEDFPNDGDLIGFDQRSTVETITVNVRAVNDAPRLNGNVVGTSDSNGPDEAWSVAPEDALGQVPITYTLREDNTQSGDVMQDYLIPVTSATGPGYQQLGLLDVFTVGPDNELVDVFPVQCLLIRHRSSGLS